METKEQPLCCLVTILILHRVFLKWVVVKNRTNGSVLLLWKTISVAFVNLNRKDKVLNREFKSIIDFMTSNASLFILPIQKINRFNSTLSSCI